MKDRPMEAVLEQTGMDGGLASALNFMKDKGDMDQDRWNLGEYRNRS